MVSAILLFGLLCGCSTPPASSASLPCPDWTDNPASNYSNKDFSNFGCAYHSNLQAQLYNKADGVKGQGSPVGNGDRESINVQKYMTAIPQTVTSMSTGGGGGGR